mgnify:CR=1 FL=1
MLPEVAAWPWVFLFTIPVGLLGFIAPLRYMPDNPHPALPRFDLAGYLYLAFGMASVSLAVDGLSGLGLGLLEEAKLPRRVPLMRTLLLVTLSALGFRAAGSARAGDPPPFGIAIGEPACGPDLIPQEVYHTVRVKVPVTETVLVAETVAHKRQ